jgi:hypothetical protein
MVLVDGAPVATPARVILGPVLIAHLPAALAPSILPSLRKALVQVRANDALVQLRAANVLHAVQRILVCVVLDEAEAARCLLEAVQAHDQALDLAALGEELVDLLLGGVEGEVADVERGRVAQLVFGRGGAAAVVVARVASALLCRDQYGGWFGLAAGSTFAVAYELGLSRRSMVLRSAGMLPNSRRLWMVLWAATAVPKFECRAELC